MKNFLRRFYYDLETGKEITYYVQIQYGGTLIVNTFEKDFEIYKSLEGRSFENTGVFEWFEPDEEIELKFNGNYNVSVDVSVTPHQLVFTEIPKPEELPEDEQPVTTEDCLNALEEVGVI